MNLQMFKLDLEKAEEDQIANIRWIIEKARDFQKKICFYFIDYAKAFDCVENSERNGNTRPPDLSLEKPICRSVRTGHGTTDWFQIGTGVHQGCILSPCLFNLYAEYIRRKAGLEEAQLPGETSITSDMQMTPPLWQKVKRN